MHMQSCILNADKSVCLSVYLPIFTVFVEQKRNARKMHRKYTFVCPKHTDLNVLAASQFNFLGKETSPFTQQMT